MSLVKASLLFPTSKSPDQVLFEADTIVDVIEKFVKLCGDEVRAYFYLNNGDYNGATFVTINGKLFTIREATKIALSKGDDISFGQVVDGG
jgi:hypothetical protein